MDLGFEKINVKVGFEIHQQLNTANKLFCSCKSVDANGDYDFNFIRSLRPTKSELGSFDKAAIFEHAKMTSIKYFSKMGLSCLVEADEEPPHDVNNDALETTLLFCIALKSHIVDEIHFMRKIVIDGSNVGGFQRTALVSTGGYLEVDDFKKIGVQSICLEEDAAKLLSSAGEYKEYGLDRLGIPLVEIALEPISGTPEQIVNVALTLGRLLRSSRRVARGIGSIRQDVNISVNGGHVVEVKGVQQISQLVKVLDYEAKRQFGLMKIAEELKNKNINDDSFDEKFVEVTPIFSSSSSNIIKKILKNPNSVIIGKRLKNCKGLIGFEPIEGIRMGKELGEFLRFFGVGGIFHSDELPNYGITVDDINTVSSFLHLSSNDAFILIGGDKTKINRILNPLDNRIHQFKIGVVAETRSATNDGDTVFLRPRAGSSRMYPETDILPIRVDKNLLDDMSNNVPLSWNQLINNIMEKYSLNKKLAEQIFDSEYYDLFERIILVTSNISPTFIASKLTEDIVSLSRTGLNKNLLTNEKILEIFDYLNKGKIVKESVVLIFEKLMKNESKSVKEAINSLNLTKIDDKNLYLALDQILNDNMSIIKEKGAHSIGSLMGKSMSLFRGKVDGSKINDYLKQKIESIINSGSP